MKKQPEVTAKTKEALVLAFCTLYMKKPINKISIKEITDLSGYNRSTFYQYFFDVYDLLEYIENDLIETMRKSLDERYEALLFPNLNLLLALFAEKENYLKAILSDYGSFHFIDRIKKEFSLTESEKASTQFGNLISYLIEFHLSTSFSLFRIWFKNGKDIPAEELLKLIHNLYTKGISTFDGIVG